MYLAEGVIKEVKIDVYGKAIILPISQLAEGCIGCSLIFGKYEDALQFVKKEGRIVKIGEVHKDK